MFNKNQSDISPKKIETIIGPSVKVEGNFKGQGDIIIDGMLVGTLETENNLKIGAGAIIEASIRANNAFVSGKVKGNISTKGKLEIASTAVIMGDIKTQILSIESGARLLGKVTMPTTKIDVAGTEAQPSAAKNQENIDTADEEK